MGADEWVSMSEDYQSVTGGAWMWRGPDGTGHVWSPGNEGMTYTSEIGEVSIAPDDHDQWMPYGVPEPLALRSWTDSLGLIIPPPPYQGPPDDVDSDGDGVPDSQDADPNDPTVQ